MAARPGKSQRGVGARAKSERAEQKARCLFARYVLRARGAPLGAEGGAAGASPLSGVAKGKKGGGRESHGGRCPSPGRWKPSSGTLRGTGSAGALFGSAVPTDSPFRKGAAEGSAARRDGPDQRGETRRNGVQHGPDIARGTGRVAPERACAGMRRHTRPERRARAGARAHGRAGGHGRTARSEQEGRAETGRPTRVAGALPEKMRRKIGGGKYGGGGRGADHAADTRADGRLKKQASE